MAIRAYKAGDSSPASQGDYTNGVCDDDTPVGAWVKFTIKADAGEYHPGPYYPMIGGDAPAEFRFSTDGTDGGAGPWGGTVNVGSVSSLGRDVWVQKKSWSRAQLLLPQGGIESGAVTLIDIGLARSSGKGSEIVTLGAIKPVTFADTGLGTDTAPLTAWVAFPAVTDTGLGTDAAPLIVYDPQINLGDLADTGLGADAFTLATIYDLGTMTDTGAGTDTAPVTLGAWITDLSTLTDTGLGKAAATVGKLLAPPALSSMTAGDASFTVTVGTVTGATSYDLRHKLTSGSTWTTVTNVGTGTETVSGLTNGSSYDVQARSNNADGSGAWSATTTVTPVAGQNFLPDGTYYLNSSVGGVHSLNTSLSSVDWWVAAGAGEVSAVKARAVTVNSGGTVQTAGAWSPTDYSVGSGPYEFGFTSLQASLAIPSIGASDYFGIEVQVAGATRVWKFPTAGAAPESGFSCNLDIYGYWDDETEEAGLALDYAGHNCTVAVT